MAHTKKMKLIKRYIHIVNTYKNPAVVIPNYRPLARFTFFFKS